VSFHTTARLSSEKVGQNETNFRAIVDYVIYIKTRRSSSTVLGVLCLFKVFLAKEFKISRRVFFLLLDFFSFRHQNTGKVVLVSWWFSFGLTEPPK